MYFKFVTALNRNKCLMPFLLQACEPIFELSFDISVMLQTIFPKALSHFYPKNLPLLASTSLPIEKVEYVPSRGNSVWIYPKNNYTNYVRSIHRYFPQIQSNYLNDLCIQNNHYFLWFIDLVTFSLVCIPFNRGIYCAFPSSLPPLHLRFFPPA